MEGDDRTFGVSFSSAGVKMLRERINENLKVFMGDYTDDTLVEYVIVLLKNGRQKDEAKSELDVFLGDDSDSFVSWLWDHLGSNLNLYAQPVELHSDGSPKTKYAGKVHAGRTELQRTSSETGNESSNKTGNYHHLQGIGLVRNEDRSESPIPKNSMLDNKHAQDEFSQSVNQIKQSLSPRPTIQKKRKRTEVLQPRKREVSRPNLSAPRRLLQFAVRDAVGTSRPPNSMAEPSLKRLRSVVSTSTENSSLKGHPQRIRKVAGLRADMSAAIKAVSDAVKDVTKARPLHDVVDRLGRSTIASNIINHPVEYREVAEDGDFVNEREDFLQTCSVLQEANTSLDDDIVDTSDYGYVGEAHDVIHVMGRRGVDMNRSGTSVGNWVENSEYQYGRAGNVEKILNISHKELDQHAVVGTSSNITPSMKMNTWKPPQYHEVRDGSEMDNIKSLNKPERWLTKEKSNLLVTSNGNAKRGIVPQHDPQKTQKETGLNSTGPSTEDTDSRTVFVSNVHFAATKDSLSRHFNKFGEVLKVNILSDTSTGLPKGSAYIEFTRKEAAEHALSLDGTSFMSRILKIVRKASAQPEAQSVMAWPRIARASPFAGRSFGRVPFARGIHSLYRPHVPIKPGARSFQWKRESSVTEASNHGTDSIILPSTPRSLTYVRTESK